MLLLMRINMIIAGGHVAPAVAAGAPHGWPHIFHRVMEQTLTDVQK